MLMAGHASNRVMICATKLTVLSGTTECGEERRSPETAGARKLRHSTLRKHKSLWQKKTA